MGRHHRANFEGGTYHVMNRGNRKAVIFEDDHDCDSFVRILIDVADIHAVKILAGCLIKNHFHCAITTRRANLSQFMEELEGRYARYSNWRHRRVGHLFQGRFRDVVIEHDIHLLIALCYIFMNPVAAGLCQRLEDYKWSTYAGTAGLGPTPAYLSLDWMDALFPDISRAQARRRLRELLSEPKPVAAYLHQLAMGVDADSVNSVLRSYIGAQMALPALPREYQLALRPPLEKLLDPSGTAERAEAISIAHVVHGYKLAEIARALRMKPDTVSKTFRRYRTRNSK